MDLTEKANKAYLARGILCVLWGQPAHGMTWAELICFIGFLDELATSRLTQQTETKEGE